MKNVAERGRNLICERTLPSLLVSSVYSNNLRSMSVRLLTKRPQKLKTRFTSISFPLDDRPRFRPEIQRSEDSNLIFVDSLKNIPPRKVLRSPSLVRQSKQQGNVKSTHKEKSSDQASVSVVGYWFKMNNRFKFLLRHVKTCKFSTYHFQIRIQIFDLWLPGLWTRMGNVSLGRKKN